MVINLYMCTRPSWIISNKNHQKLCNSMKQIQLGLSPFPTNSAPKDFLLHHMVPSYYYGPYWLSTWYKVGKPKKLEYKPSKYRKATCKYAKLVYISTEKRHYPWVQYQLKNWEKPLSIEKFNGIKRSVKYFLEWSIQFCARNGYNFTGNCLERLWSTVTLNISYKIPYRL